MCTVYAVYTLPVHSSYTNAPSTASLRFVYLLQLAPHIRLPLISLRDLMLLVRPSNLIPAESLLDAVTYHSDPIQWSGESIMVSEGRNRGGGAVRGNVLLHVAFLVLLRVNRFSALFFLLESDFVYAWAFLFFTLCLIAFRCMSANMKSFFWGGGRGGLEILVPSTRPFCL